MRITRLVDQPIIDSATCDSIGTNIQGPSLIRAPEWLPNPLGAYLLYFADHKGGHIRLAYADRPEGPWTVHRPGALQLADSCFLTEPPTASDAQLERARDRFREALGSDYSVEEALVDATTPHIASPDVHVDHERRRIVMYFHGLERFGVQVTRVATSSDGINFRAQPEVLGSSYFRVFRYRGWHYALVMPGLIMRSRDGMSGFEPGPQLFVPQMRHAAVAVRGDELHVFWTRVGDAPEAILRSTVDLRGDWLEWRDSEPRLGLRPERSWEGSDVDLIASRRGAVDEFVNQLRDPCLFDDDGRTFLLYACGGESAIGLASIDW
ncbi:MAG: hypothetical protein AAF567_01260 [Actinomycetota bacterium]